MLNGRKRTKITFAALSVAAVGLSFGIQGSPAQAEPDIETVRDRVERLYHEAEQAQERANDAEIELRELNRELRSLAADEERQGDALADIRSTVRDAVLQSYQGGDLGAAGDILSGNGDDVMTELTTMSTVNDFQDSLLDDYNDELQAFSIRREQTEERRDQVAALEEQLREEQEAVEEKAAEADALLDELEAEEREEILSRGGDRVPSEVPASGRAAAAIEYAMAQVGDSYVWGAAGPDAFDCSGLTMMAWAQAGVSLPHSSSAQFGSGTQVAESDLQPGDLVFYYSPISHVGMYIGNGLMVHAANPGVGVVVSDLHYMPYVGAVRPG